jgi:hypothetical protein
VSAREKGRSARSITALAAATAALVIAWPASSPAVAISPPACAYVEGGAPGPAGNELKIAEPEFGSVRVRRSGSEIQAIDTLAGSEGEIRTCTGPPATVDNIDVVHVTVTGDQGTDYTFFWLDESGGMLGPGASPETDGQSEIEVQLEPTSESVALYVKLIGRPEPDQQLIENQQRTLVADLNGMDPSRDPELTVPDASFLDIYAGAGDDTVLIPNGQAFLEHSSIKGQAGQDVLAGNGVDIAGGPGNDVIRGGWFGEFFHGDSGRDRIYGGRGPDHLGGNRGNDYVHGGPGADVLRGGSGKDKLKGGPGRDRRIQ